MKKRRSYFLFIFILLYYKNLYKNKNRLKNEKEEENLKRKYPKLFQKELNFEIFKNTFFVLNKINKYLSMITLNVIQYYRYN